MRRSILRTTAFAFLSLSILASASFAASNAATNDRPTYHRDVLPILQENCQNCHRDGGANLGGQIAPMAFTFYEETRPWAKAIARQVEARTMPPWHASPEQRGVFHNERTLNDSEIETLVRWARTGAVAGDPEDAPPAPDWRGGARKGPPRT